MSDFETRNYMIFNITETGLIDFNEVLETSAETLRKSVNGEKAFVKWDGETIPDSVSQIPSESKWGPYTHTEILTILAGEEWTSTGSIGID
jgi:hypothetical protein